MGQLKDISVVRHEAMLDAIADGFMAINPDGALDDCNQALCDLLGLTRDELLSKSLADLHVGETEESATHRLAVIKERNKTLYEAAFLHKDGRLLPVEISMSYTPVEGGLFFAVVRDIHERKVQHELVALRSRLSDHANKRNPQQLIQEGVDTAARILGVAISAFTFVDTEHQRISLSAWSLQYFSAGRKVIAETKSCDIADSEAWGICIDQANTFLYNDKDHALPVGALPGIDTPLDRLIIAPVIRDERVVAMIAVANRIAEFDDSDVDTVSVIADETYRFFEIALQEQEIEYLAFRDALTGLPNRKLLDDRLQQAIAHAKRSKQLCAICYVDLDGFKPVNDQHGHAVGDRLLVSISRRIKSALRGEDTLARIGGDEFVMVLNDLESLDQCEQAVERLLQIISEPIQVDLLWLWVTASIGVTVYPDDDDEPESLIRHADQAMYNAKEAGKNKIALYDALRRQKSIATQTLKDELEDAIRDNALSLLYQPRIDLTNGKLAGVEALVRWPNSSKGYLNPSQFLPLISGRPIEFELDQWVLKEAVEQHLKWRDQGMAIPISINLSPYTVQHRGFPEHLALVLATCPDDVAHYLEFEVLETGAIRDPEHVSRLMYACIDLGVRFSLDDFGTGYSSLSYFHKLPIEMLKIDQAFVRDMLVDPKDRDIVEGVIRLADAIGRPVVAEGVESPELGMMLLQLGCRYAQGFAISRPIPPDQMINWIANWPGNFYWKRVIQNPNGPTHHYDVNVAILSHKFWLEKLKLHLDSGGRLAVPELDHTQCQFGRWLDGIGGAKYSARPSFPALRDLHQKIHSAAHRLELTHSELSSAEASAQLACLADWSADLEQQLIALIDETPIAALA